MTTETLSITHVRILIDADARLAFVSVREFDDSYPDHPFTDADSTYTSEDYNGADWLAEARFVADSLAKQWGLVDIVEERVESTPRRADRRAYRSQTMQSNQFVLVNMAGGTHGGTHGGTYRLRADGRLPLRAVRALVNAPFGGYHFSGPAAPAAASAWRTLRDDALDQCVSVLDLV